MGDLECIGDIGVVHRTRFDTKTQTWYAEASMDAMCRVVQQHRRLTTELAALRAQVAALTAERDAAQQRAEAAEAGAAAMREAVHLYHKNKGYLGHPGKEFFEVSDAMDAALLTQQQQVQLPAGVLEELEAGVRDANEWWSRHRRFDAPSVMIRLSTAKALAAALKGDGGGE